jgi:ADP-dependent NAD(P)H-hydrate dehydratase / NAD(P)H-hydrate epimerase
MRRIDALTPDQPLFGLAHTRRIETAALAGLPPHTLMQRAGAAVARLALALAPHARCIRIVVGPGNNGGDGLDAAIRLMRAGKHVEVLLAAEPAAADARDALQRARAAGVAIDPAHPRALQPQDLAIDALLGIGARAVLDGPLLAAIEGLAGLPCPVLAVDLPSGLDADTGHTPGACVRADHVLSLLTLKPGLFTAHGRDQAPTVWLDTLGIDTSAESPEVWLGGAKAASAPRRRHAQHKGSFGDVTIVGGAPGMAGAALLAARAAHAAGAGRVFVELLDAQAATVDVLRPELMLRQEWSAHAAPDNLKQATVVCGCGGGDAVRTASPPLLAHAARLVLDADALNLVAADDMLRQQVRMRASRGLATLVTPHPLEAARLLGRSSSEVQSDRLRAAQELAAALDCAVVLKGSGSVLAAPGRTPRINASGNASLATAGTGDVLAGWMGGHWAQRTEAEPFERAWQAAIHAAWLHGFAADEAALPVLRAGVLIERMAAAAAR